MASDRYQLYRPHYPATLFVWLVSMAREHKLAWDCATGNGQSAIELSKWFTAVVATDASEQQVKNAVQAEGVSYRVASAEYSGFDTQSVDLITVAQALHWFDIGAFTQETSRVLKPGGILAAWTYNLLQVSPEIDRLVYFLYHDVLGAYWPAERKLVENGYQDIRLPFEELTAPEFSMQASWDLSQLCGYLKTWSAFKRYQQHTQRNPLEEIMSRLEIAWGEAVQKRLVSWPLSIRIQKTPD